MNNIFSIFPRGFGRILFKVKFSLVFLMMAICMPCIVYFVFLSIGQGVREDSNSFQMTKVGGLEIFSKVGRRTPTTSIGIMSQIDNLWKESTFEFSSGFFEMLFVPPAFAEEMGEQCSDSGSNKAEQETDDEISQSDLLLLIVGYVMGMISSLFGVFMYYQFYT